MKNLILSLLIFGVYHTATADIAAFTQSNRLYAFSDTGKKLVDGAYYVTPVQVTGKLVAYTASDRLYVINSEGVQIVDGEYYTSEVILGGK